MRPQRTMGKRVATGCVPCRIPRYADEGSARARRDVVASRHGGRIRTAMRIVSLVPTLAIAALVAAASAARAADPPSEETIAYFKQNCASCHTIGGGKL